MDVNLFDSWEEYHEMLALILLKFDREFDVAVTFQRLESFFFRRFILDSDVKWEFIMELKASTLF